jgi:N-acetylmuramoyl-L-alanine amidase
VARRVVVIIITGKLRQRLFCALCGMVLAGACICLAAGRPFVLQSVTGSLSEQIAGRLVVIDPGHGGSDPGAVAPDGTLEKDIVLSIAKHLQARLHQAAVYTMLTRSGDGWVKPAPGSGFFGSKRQDLIERAEIANRNQADLFISIHCNSFPQSIWSGAQTFYYPDQEESRKLAAAIQTELVRRLGPNRRQANAGDYRVLKEAQMPAVVVEAGFLSNPREARLLADPSYQERVAEAIYWGIIRYLQSTGTRPRGRTREQAAPELR